jgi:alkylmercury lyase
VVARFVSRPGMNTTAGSLSTLADSLAGTFPCCDDAPLALALLDELAKGEPVTIGRLASAAHRDERNVAATLHRWPNVHRDRQARVVAFGGLGVTPTPHRFEVAGRRLYTWCAWDTLFLPALLGQEARVESACPVTGTEVRLTVGPDGAHEAQPPSLRVSFPAPASTVTSDITASFCCHVHFLADQDAAEKWLGENQGALTLSVEDAVELGRLATRPLLEDGRPRRESGAAGSRVAEAARRGMPGRAEPVGRAARRPE